MKFDSTRGVVGSGLAAVLAAVLMLVTAGVAPVEAQTPTAEQMRIFQSLPPDQRNQILQQMGGGAAGTIGSARAGAGNGQVVVQQPAGVVEDEAGHALPPGVAPRVRGGELVLLEPTIADPNSARSITEITPDGRQIVRQATASGQVVVRTAEEMLRLTELRDRILRRNPYELSATGVLQLPGLEPISLGGLNPDEIRARLVLDPALREFDIVVTLLRVQPQGVAALKPFGYDMLREGSTAFVPGTDIPVPANYVVGAGDVMEVQLYGQTSRTYNFPVGRDGSINIPELGPIDIGGLTFGAARSLLEGRVRTQMIGTQARVSLSDLRSVRVFVLGDAERPGSYVVSGLSTATNALFASGGVKKIGSLRRIEIKRDGRTLRTLDLYDVLLKGDTSDDLRLQSGDTVFVPPVGPLVAVEGEVNRPAIYEITPGQSLADVVTLAGGATAEADRATVTIGRIGESGARQAIAASLGPGAGSFELRAGDTVRVARVSPIVVNGIELRGHVHRPGTYAWRDGMRLSDLVGSADDVLPDADLSYVLVRRESADSRTISAVSADLATALRDRGSAADILLAPRDVVTVFDVRSPRTTAVDPLLAEIERQAGPDRMTGLVTVSGRVNTPGRYPLESGMRVTDLLRAGGGLQDSAYGSTAELTRYYAVQGERRRAELLEVNLAGARAGDPAANLELQPYDVLMIKELPEWGRVEQVTLAGEVRFPGTYQIRRGETLSSLIDRAGGLTPLAFPEGAVFTREDLQVREREQLDRLASRLQADIAVLSLQASQTNPAAATSLSAGQGLLEQLRQTRPVGRLVIDLEVLLARGSGAEVMLRGGDRLVIPRLAQEVSVLGEVNNPTSHLYRDGMARDDVIALSGGTSQRADRKRTYVVRADGSVVGSSSRWFGSGNVDLRPGDTVVVPLDAERMRPLPLWTAVTTIVYNLAVAAAAVGSL